jgi:hypothetical protein
MSIGRPDPAVPADIKPRLPASVVLHHERYGWETQEQGVAHYDATYRRFQQEQQMNAVGWVANVFSRLETIAQMAGRDRLKQILHELGFGLK